MEGAKYQWGDQVKASNDIHNDGTFPQVEENAVLVYQGEQGYILQVGKEEGGVFLYVVEFGGKMVGCFEDELSNIQSEQ